MRKLLLAALFLVASATGAWAQYFPSISISANPPDPTVACSSRPMYVISTKQLCTCNASTTKWMCELADLDKLVLGGTSSEATQSVCIAHSEVAGRPVILLETCNDEDAIPGLLIPPRYTEADKPICEAAIEGVRIYLYAETGVIAGRYASCVGRADGSGYDWILGYELGNTEAPL